MSEKSKKRIGLYMDEDTLKLCDAGMKLTDAKNRSDYIEKAVQLMSTWLVKNSTSEILTPALESVINARISSTEDILSRVIFKQGVEIAMLEHLMALAYRIEPDLLADIRKTCIDDVAKLNGNFESIVEMENERKRLGKDKIFLKEDE